LIFGTEGGVNIEEVAARNPEKVVSLNIDYLDGVKIAEVKSWYQKQSLTVCCRRNDR